MNLTIVRIVCLAMSILGLVIVLRGWGNKFYGDFLIFTSFGITIGTYV